MYFTLNSLQSILNQNSLYHDFYIMIESPREKIKFDVVDKLSATDWRMIEGYDTLKATVKTRTISDDMENYILLSKSTEEDGEPFDAEKNNLFLYDLVNLIGTNLGIFKPGYYGKIKVGLYDTSDKDQFDIETIVSDLRVFHNMKVENIDIVLPGIRINAYPWWSSF